MVVNYQAFGKRIIESNMGGHGHGHDTIKIPSSDCYKIENSPALVKFQERLASEGLEDPWLRNEAWRYHPDYKTKTQRVLTYCLRGWKIGIPAFLITVGIEQLLALNKKDDHDHGDHH
uniref:NADH dehydrogenase [ubiquinone] 1 beta subcomplex subunit 3 n=2 Tax=Vespula pensylvanica TaxID=30213 RepID=A0A834U7E2_VESPE|nr:hypothetical protein H0235_010092 [Vespula pensylvanica]